MLTALAQDPGPDRSGVAVVAFDGRRFRLLHGEHMLFRGGGHVAGAVEELVGFDRMAFLLDDVLAAEGIVVVEQVIGYAYELFRVPYLLETRGMGERVVTMAIERGIPTHMISESEIRGQLCRSASAGDGPLRAVVDAMVDGIPTIVEKHRVHVYDAIAAAIVGICRALKIAIPRTPAGERALMLSLAAEKVERSAKRAKKARKNAAASREPSKSARARRGAVAKKGWTARRGA